MTLEHLVQPQLHSSQVHSDQRGLVRHFGSLVLPGIVRVYFIEPDTASGFRGWHGHKHESKSFRCIKGSFAVASVQIKEWENPTATGPAVLNFLSEAEDGILIVPKGYANGILALEEGSVLMVMSDRTLQQSEADDYRYPPQTFAIPEINRNPFN